MWAFLPATISGGAGSGWASMKDGSFFATGLVVQERGQVLSPFAQKPVNGRAGRQVGESPHRPPSSRWALP